MTIVNCDKKDCVNNSKNKDKSYSSSDGICNCDEIQIEDRGSACSCNSYEENW